MSVIAATDVFKSFGGVAAVRGASLEVGAGEVVGLIGPNGAGKTTLIRTMLGLLEADRGSVVLAGGVPEHATRARTGYVPQSLGLWTDLTLDEHLGMIRELYPDVLVGDDDVRRLAAGRVIGDLPLGLRRRAAFEVALAHRPDALILDEPTSGVDPLARQQLWEMIRREADRGAAVLVSTHYLDEAARCDRVVLMSEGAVVSSGTVAELVHGERAVVVEADRWDVAWQRLEDAGFSVLPAGRRLRVLDAAAAPVIEALDGLAAEVGEVAASLEEVFLSRTST